ncbi:MAG: DUF6056 family protein [Lactobacillus sp.]|jgi:hypothetical protein|nr:DUF6056 family protein [Lactobacillus sp.]
MLATKSKQISKLWLPIIFILQWILVAGLNFLAPLFDDDLYMAQRYSSFAPIIDAAKYEYYNWNGRSIGQTIFRSLLNIPWPMYKILNALVFCILTFLILLYTSKNWRQLSPLRYMGIIAASWLFFPAFGQTILWAAGSGNYLWTTVLILAMGLPYLVRTFDIQTFTDKHRVNGWLKALFILPLGLLAGWSNENTSGGLIMAILLMLLYQLIFAKNKPAIWEYTGLMATVFGFLMLITAPGNAVRTAATLGASYQKISIVTRTLTGIKNVTVSLGKLHYPLLIAIVVAVILLHTLWYNKDRMLKMYLWLLCGFATLYVLAVSPLGADGGRSFFGGIVFLIIGIFSSIPDRIDLATSDQRSRLTVLIVQDLFILLAIVAFIPGFKDLYQSSSALRTRYTYIQKEVKAGHTHLKVPPLYYYPHTKYAVNYDSQDLTTNPKEFPNDGYIVYFKGLKSIVIDRSK